MMYTCSGTTKKGAPCKRKVKEENSNCYQHAAASTEQEVKIDETKVDESKIGHVVTVSGKRTIADLSLFDSDDPVLWEKIYEETIEIKYSKHNPKRNFSREIHGSSQDNPPIFLIPRVRAGPSYKQCDLFGSDPSDLQYCPISKGYPMQKVSSFTIGPIVGEGLCLVNAAFSKIICVMHIEGGGCIDFRRKCFWKPAKNPDRKIRVLDDSFIEVDGKEVDIHEWLRDNEDLWLEEWERWSKSIALTSRGDFHWDKCGKNESPTIAYKAKQRYMRFQEWKIECYVRPSFELLPETDVFQFLYDVYHNKKVPLGLVHPMTRESGQLQPLTKEYLKELIESDSVMACQPYVVAAKLLGVKI